MPEFRDVIDLVHSIEDEELLADFLVAITTEKERHEFAYRLEIIKRLIAGEPQQQIARDLGVGVATVSRGSRELAQGRFKIIRREVGCERD